MKAEDWIRVTDRLPEGECAVVLVYDDRQGILMADYDEGYGFSSCEHGFLEYVTHWMPIVLPKID